MQSNSLKILKHVAKNGDITLKEAINLRGKKIKNHKEQYPLALLICEEFIGTTVPFPTMDGTEKMPEFMGTIFLHMNRLERDNNGNIKYKGITSSGCSFNEETVFIRAKGALYLDELKQKRIDRVISFALGFLAAWVAMKF